MHNKLSFTFLILFVLCATSASAQLDSVRVDINIDVKHEVGGISTFDRNKFITIHSDITEQEWDGNNFTEDLRAHFLNGYDVYLGRNTGGITWWLKNVIGEDPTRPGYANPQDILSVGNTIKSNYASKSNYHPYEFRNDQIMAAQLHPFWPDGQMTNKSWAFSQEDTEDNPFGTATGEYMGRFIKDAFGSGGNSGQNRPQYVEIVNEPIWHLVDFGNDSPEKIFHFHNAVATQIRAYNNNLVIGGYCTAFPDHDKNNFREWEERWKLFMDIAGENMDFWTIHLYDFPSFNGLKQYRKGSNMEATFDMMEQYSFLKFNQVKPFMISEFGAQTHDYSKQWSPFRDWLNIKSTNAMLLQFMERPHIINKVIPFIPLKAEWGREANGNPYSHRLLRKANEVAGEQGEHYVYTDYVKIYELWKDVNGKRVDTYASNLDVMVDAYVEDDKVYVILNNLKFETVDIDLNLKGLNNNAIQQIEVKHLYLDGQAPVLKTELINSPLEGVSLRSEATMVLTYTFTEEVQINHTSFEEKFYADTYFKPIEKDNEERFNISGLVPTEFGEATLRVGIGRAHGKSLTPTILINGNRLDIPNDFRGDEQVDRAGFFGVIEVPVPIDYLDENNAISIKFEDDGGHISSLALQHFRFSREITRTENPPIISSIENTSKKKITIYPNPTSGTLQLSTTAEYLQGDFSIIDQLGRIVKTGVIKAETQIIDINHLPNGVYSLRFGKEHESIIKFVKQ